MKLAAPLAVTLAVAALPAAAALPKGAPAPMFTTQAALAGKTFQFDLAAALKKGPVVVYFYPKAFTSGCTVEAHAFAEAAKDFQAAGASLIGLSADSIADIQRFSVAECRNAFPVGVASPATIKGYDVALAAFAGHTNRTSYVIAQDGRIALVHSDLNPAKHVQLTLAAVRALKH